MLSLRHIEVFHAVYVSGSVSAAARVLNISQPSVTKVIQHAEAVLGFKLFDRQSGRLIPTEDAHAMTAEVSGIVERVQSLRQTGANLRYGKGGSIRVSALPSLSLKVVPDTAAIMLTKNTDVSFDLQTLHHEDIVRKLYERESDIVIAFDIPNSMPVRSQKLGRGELVAFYRRTDFPNVGAKFSLGALARTGFISVVRSGPIGVQLAGELSRNNIKPTEIASVRTFYIAGALVKAGAGVAVLDIFTAHALRDADTDFRSFERAIEFDVHAITLDSRPPSSLASAFLKELRKAIEGYST